MRDREVLDEKELLQPVAGSPGPIVPNVDDTHSIAEQIPDEERDAGDEMIAPDDDALLDPGASPEFDHSLRKRKPASDT